MRSLSVSGCSREAHIGYAALVAVALVAVALVAVALVAAASGDFAAALVEFAAALVGSTIVVESSQEAFGECVMDYQLFLLQMIGVA